MPLGERRVRQLTGAGLVVATLATRLPFATKMLSEFDSINFAVGTFRFSLEQVTPHFPGYILHILFAKCLLLFTSDVNQAFVWISTLLSVGSVLYLWRAGAALRGERVGLIAACIWLVTPIFWYYGIVATAYEYEAFFASALLFHALRLYRSPRSRTDLFALIILLSLAGAARQSSLLLFLPIVLYTVLVTRQPFGRLLQAFGIFVLLTGAWLGVLVAYCGGVAVYVRAMGAEHIYQSQSILFGNPVAEHLAVIAKCLIYLGASVCVPAIVIVILGIRYRLRLRAFVTKALRSEGFRIVSIVALPPLAFYLFVYFMKGGYLLNIIPSCILIFAVLIDQCAIWYAHDIKIIAGNQLRLTRPIITKQAILLTSVIAVMNIAWFVLPFPGSTQADFNRAFAYDSFGAAASTLPSQRGALQYAFDRVLAFTSLHSANQADRLHQTLLKTLTNEAQTSELTILDTWWHRWDFYYLPNAVSYDIRDHIAEDSIAVGRSFHFSRTMDLGQTIEIPHSSDVVLIIPREHPSFKSLQSQVHLEQLSQIDGLDMWRITDSAFTLHWKNRVFVKR